MAIEIFRKCEVRKTCLMWEKKQKRGKLKLIVVRDLQGIPLHFIRWINTHS